MLSVVLTLAIRVPIGSESRRDMVEIININRETMTIATQVFVSEATIKLPMVTITLASLLMSNPTKMMGRTMLWKRVILLTTMVERLGLVGLSFSVKKEQQQILEKKSLQDFFSELMQLGGSSVLVAF